MPDRSTGVEGLDPGDGGTSVFECGLRSPEQQLDQGAGSARSSGSGSKSRGQTSDAPSRYPLVLMAISLRQLRYFVRTVDAGNITRAAEQLFVAQPALGLQIRQLEESLGVSLLSRHSRGVSPTRAGSLLYERACEILRMVDDTQRVVAAAGRQDVEAVVLGLTYGVMALLGRDIVIAARDELPGIQLTLIEEMSIVLMDSLEREELDIAVAYDVHRRPGLLRVPMIEEELVFVSSPSTDPDDRPIAYRELIARPLVLQGPRDVVRQQLEATAQRLALPINAVLDVTAISAVKSLVAHGDGVTVMPYGTVIADVTAGRLKVRRIVDPPLKRTLYFARSSRRAQFKREPELVDFLGRMMNVFAERMGSLANRLPTLDTPLSQTVDALAEGGTES